MHLKILLILTFVKTLHGIGTRENVVKKEQIMRNETPNFCQTRIEKNGQCIWKNPTKPFFINSTSSCSFHCWHQPKKINTGTIRFEVHMQNNPSMKKIFVSARQEKTLRSWTIPVVYEANNNKKQIFGGIEESICPDVKMENETLFFDIATYSESSIAITVSMSPVHLIIQLNENVTVKSTPVSPWIKLYQWQNDDEQAVLILANSQEKTGGNVCAYMSIQNAECPLGVRRNEIISGIGRFQTFQQNGNMIAYRDEFPDGVFIVVLPLLDDFPCTTETEKTTPNITKRVKTTTITVIPHVAIGQKTLVYVGFSASYLAVVAISFFVMLLFMKRYFNQAVANMGTDMVYPIKNDTTFVGRLFGGILNDEVERSENMTGYRVVSRNLHEEDDASDTDYLHTNRQFMVNEDTRATAPEMLPITSGENTIEYPNLNRSVEIVVPKISVGDNPRYVQWWTNWSKYLHDKSEETVEGSNIHKHIVLAAVFTFTQLIDIVKSFLKEAKNYGSENECYFNGRCMTSAGEIAGVKIEDFSKVFSSFSYSLCGIVFYVLVRMHKKYAAPFKIRKSGVNRNYEIFESLAFGLVIQGAMSAFYHVCPNETTLRFDMLFMYIMSFVFIILLWSFRHDFAVQQIYSSVCFVGFLLLGAEARSWLPQWLFSTIVYGGHMLFTITISFMMVKTGSWSFSPRTMWEIWKQWQPMIADMSEVFQDRSAPKHRIVTTLRTILGIVANMLLVTFGIVTKMEIYKYILVVGLINMVFYTLNYVISKKFLYGEAGRKISWLMIGLSAIFWIAALQFFSYHLTDSRGSPSNSRSLNRDCVLFGIFDWHDLWHFTSAMALFCSFMGFLHLDDDIVEANRADISVF